MDSTKKTSDIFFATFVGEYIEIVTKYEVAEHGKMIVHGYMLDMDDEYYFLGENPIEISAAIKKENVNFISITVQVDPTVQLLEDMPVPDDELDQN